MKIERLLLESIVGEIEPGRVVVIYGPRQSGKTTLVRDLIERLGDARVLYVNADERQYHGPLTSQDHHQLGSLVKGYRFVIIDEAQRIENIGINLKIIVDTFKEVALIVTGSASLDLANKISEPLTGRTKTSILYPVSFAEIVNRIGEVDAAHQIDRWLIWGSYPRVVTLDNAQERTSYLSEVASSYLYRDVLELEQVRKAQKIIGLLRLLAFQIGSEVAISELSSGVELDQKTVNRYLDLLEQSFVIFRVSGFSRNLRKEVAKTSRYYFFDNGIRNAVVANFNSLDTRNDAGQLWENFLMVERRKRMAYRREHVNMFFWRTYDRQEIDLVEEYGGELRGFEFKWSARKRPKPPRDWLTTYGNASFTTISPENYLQFIV